MDHKASFVTRKVLKKDNKEEIKLEEKKGLNLIN